MDACLDYLRENGAEPALVIDPHTVVTAPWTTFKCQFGCENFGKNHCCPPEAPDYTRTRAVLDSFSTGIMFRVHHWNATAMAAEGARRLFLDGYYKALAFGSGPASCVPPARRRGAASPGRPSPPWRPAVSTCLPPPAPTAWRCTRSGFWGRSGTILA